MKPTYVYCCLIFLNLLILGNTIGLLYYQSQHNEKTENIEETSPIDVPDVVEVSKVVSLPQTELSQEPIKVVPVEPATVSIGLYAGDNVEMTIFTTLKDRSDLVALESNSDWTEVISSRGFPVWVRGDLVKEIRSGYVEVIVARANARTKPNTNDSVSVGKLLVGDVLKVNRKQGEWIRVWSPLRFRAWVKTTELSQSL